MKRLSALSVFFFFVIFLAIANLYYTGKSNRRTTGNQTRWQTVIRQSGPESAKQLFRLEAASYDYKKQHEAAHTFGRALFAVFGNKGITFCDESFGYGCFHGFFTVAIRSSIPASFQIISDACSAGSYQQQVECLHGAGHGMIATLGHNNILQALDACTNIAPGPTAKACATGVFMEYNFRTMDDTASGTSTRSFDKNTPNDPCDRISDVFRPYCYQFQANWWYSVLNKDIARVDRLCGRTVGSESKKYCYRGIGYTIAAQSNYDKDKTIIGCMVLKNTTDQAICRAGAASGFLKVREFETVALTLCDGLSRQNKETCISAVEITQPQ